MSAEYSVEEVREAAGRTIGLVSAMLTAYAERIKADEGANDRIDFKGMWNAMSDRAYTHPPAQAAQVDETESRLAAANALLRDVSRYLEPWRYPEAVKRIDEHLQGAGDEA